MADFDLSEIIKLAADLGEVSKNAGPNIRKAIEVTARNVKDDWKRPLAGSATVPAGAASITYDVKGTGSEVSAEVGPDKARNQATIVGMLEYGTPSTGPTGYGAAALQKNNADFQRGLEIALAQAEKAAGL